MRKIPHPIIDILSQYIANTKTHNNIDNLFSYAGAPGPPPEGNKIDKIQAWLQRTNKKLDKPLIVLGKVIEGCMEVDVQGEFEIKGKLESILKKYHLTYTDGGIINEGSFIISGPLSENIKLCDIPTVEIEFNKAILNITSRPEEAVSAASNMLEAVFKSYIEDEGLDRPKKQSLNGVWKIVQEHLGLDPKNWPQDEGLRKILSGICSIVDGIGSLRNHASSSHAGDKKRYKLKPRHSRLAVHSSYTLALFILETWDEKCTK